MIHGFISLLSNGGNVATVLSGFSESYQMTTSQKSNNKRAGGASHQDRLKHSFSDELNLGVLVGDYENRSVFCSHHLACMDECNKIAASFLFYANKIEDVHGFARVNESYMRNKSGEPFLLVLVEGASAVAITSYGHDDYEVKTLTQGSYFVRDFMIQNVTAEEMPKFSGILDEWLQNHGDATTAAVSMVCELQGKMGCWPPASGLGLTLLKINDNASLTITDPGLKRKATDESGAKTKGVVTGFNFYSKTTREAVLAEYGHQLQNNELNKVLGERWKRLSRGEKEPFMQLAEMDKRRYKEEKGAKLDCSQSVSGESKSEAKRTLTAYNHYIRQEKQFVFGLNISEPQTKFGKHGGDRWAAMAVSEKSLYLVIHEVEAAAGGGAIECA